MDIQNNSIVTDADTDVLDSQITQISNDFAETYYFDNEQQEELEMLVAKCMKLGELYERKKWQAAKAQAVPEGFVLVEKTKLMQIVGSAAIIEPITRGNPLMSKYKTELDFILSTVRAVLEVQEPTND